MKLSRDPQREENESREGRAAMSRRPGFESILDDLVVTGTDGGIG